MYLYVCMNACVTHFKNFNLTNYLYFYNKNFIILNASMHLHRVTCLYILIDKTQRNSN